VPATTKTENKQNKIAMKECVVCLEKKESYLFSGCSPDCSNLVCDNCVCEDVKAKLSDGVAAIYCSSCRSVKINKELTLDHLRIVLAKDRNLLNRLTDILTQRSLQPETYHCPYVDCSAVMYIDPVSGQSYNIIRCHSCTRKSCYTCKDIWHEEYTCNQWKNRESITAQQFKLTEEHLRQIGAKMCPKCTMNTIKDGGCDHMKCTNCGTDYSWVSAKLA